MSHELQQQNLEQNKLHRFSKKPGNACKRFRGCVQREHPTHGKYTAGNRASGWSWWLSLCAVRVASRTTPLKWVLYHSATLPPQQLPPSPKLAFEMESFAQRQEPRGG